MIEELVAELEGRMFAGAEPPPRPIEALVALIDSHRRFLVEQPDRARLLFRLQAEELNPAAGLTDFAGLHARWTERTAPRWAAAQAEGQFADGLDHDATATFVIGALRGIALEWLLAPAQVDPDAAYAHLLRFVQAGLLA